MPFEPKVLESIRDFRRKAARGRLATGEDVAEPVIMDIEFLPGALLVAFGSISMLSVLLAPPGTGYILLVLAVTLVIFLVLALVHSSEDFIVKLAGWPATCCRGAAGRGHGCCTGAR